MNRHSPISRPAKDAPAPAAAAALPLAEARIALALDGDRFLLDDGRLARQALSCLIAPEQGDCVLAGGGADCFVLHVLQRADATCAELSVPGASELRIRQARLVLLGRDELALHSLGKVDIGAAGLLSLQAENIYSAASESLVQSMRHYAGSAEQYLLDVSELLRMHGGHTILHAEQDVKLDGERISLG